MSAIVSAIMASVFKRHAKSKFYSCMYFNAEGKRKLLSTGKTRKVDAQAFADEVESKSRNLDYDSSVRQRAVASLLEEAATNALRGSLTEEVARDILNRIMVAGGTKPLDEAKSVRLVFDNWLEDSRSHIAQATFKRYQTIVTRFLDGLSPELLSKPLDHLTTEDVRLFVKRERDEGRAAGSVRLAEKVVRMVLKSAVDTGVVNRNVALGLAKSGRVVQSKSTQSQEAFTKEQVEALLAASRKMAKRDEQFKEWELGIMLAYYTGQRQSDIASMRWGQVDEVEGVLKFRQEKGDNLVTIPMHPKVVKAFKSCTRSLDPSVFIMPSLEALDTGTGALSKRFQEIMEEAKIEVKKTEALGAKGRSRASLSFHSLRHAFNTALANSGVSQETRMLLTGQNSKKVNDGYTHTALDTLRAAMERIE